MGLLVEADDATRADVLAWMADFEARALDAHPGQTAAFDEHRLDHGATPTPGDAEAVLAVTPTALERMFVSEDRTEAQILFSVGHLSLDDQGRLLDELPAVHEAAAEHDTGTDDSAVFPMSNGGRAVSTPLDS